MNRARPGPAELRPQVNGRRLRKESAVERLAGGFLDRVHHQQQVRIEGALHVLFFRAGSISLFIHADAAYVAADRTDIVANIIAVHGPDRIYYLGKKPEQRAIGGFFPAAVAFNRAVCTDSANPFSKDRFQFG